MGTLVFQATLGGAVNIIGPNIANTINFTLPSADGTSGQTWTTNGSGVLAFGTLGIAGGGTGQITATAAFNALAPSQTGNSGKYLTTDGTNSSWATNPLGTVTSVGGTGTVNGITLTGTVTSSGNLTLGGTLSGVSLTTQVTGTLPTANGGTNLSSFTSGGVVYASSSNVLATGSALNFDGNNLSMGGSISSSYNQLSVNNTSSTGYARMLLNIGASGANGVGTVAYAPGIFFKIGTDSDASSTPMVFNLNGTTALTLTSSSLYTASGINVGIGNSNPQYPLDVSKAGGGNFVAYFKNTTNTTPYTVRVQEAASAASGYPLFDVVNSAGTNAHFLVHSGTGNVGIGTSSPLNKLDVRAASAAMGNYQTIQAFSTDIATIDYGGGISLGGYYSGTSSIAQFASIAGRKENGTAGNYAGYLSFGTNSQATGVREVMRLDAAGILGLGVVPSSWSTSYGVIQGYSGWSIFGDGTNSNSVDFMSNAYKSGASTYTYLANSYATRYQQKAGVHAWYNAPSTTGTVSFTQAMTLGADGNLLIGSTSGSWTGDDAKIYLVASSGWTQSLYTTGSGGGTSIMRVDNTGAKFVDFRYSTGNVGSITTNGTITLYNTTSDQRLKENIQDAESASSLIDSLQVRKFDWKSDSSHQRYGFVAQELVTVAPEAVHQPTDTDEMMAVDYSKLVPMLVKEIQSLRQRLSAANL
jgi:hypothetical protein